MKKYVKFIIGVVFILIIMYGIYSYIRIKRKDAYVKLEINGQEIVLTGEISDELDLKTLNSEHDTILKLDFKNANVKINGKIIKDPQEVSLGKLNISQNNKIEICIKLVGDIKYKKYFINTLPSKFPKYTVEGKSEYEGEYYLSTYILSSGNKQHYIYKINQDGDVTFYKAIDKRGFQFKKNESNGKVRYTYLEITNYAYGGINNSVPSKLVVLDENYNEIEQINYKTENEEISTENHDYVFFDDNHYIVGAYTRETVQNVPEYEGENINVWNCRIQEVKDGEILWEFQSIKYPNLYTYCNEPNTNIKPGGICINYMHFNSMEIDPTDNNLVCSFRNIDAIMKISRETGEILWILGGKGDEFGLTEEQKFYKQHSISFLSDNSILLYDNNKASSKTRIVNIKIDEENKKIKSYKSYNSDLYVARMGSVQAIDEEKCIYLMAYGLGNVEYGFKEFNPQTSEDIFKFKLEGNNSLYCVNKY